MIESMPPRDRLQAEINAWWRQFVDKRLDYCRDPQMPSLSPAIDDPDASSFLGGLEAGLFEVREGYRIQSPLQSRLKSGRPPELHLFEKGGGGSCRLRQETIPHYAAAAELVIDYGWPPDQVAIESPGMPGLASGALDLVVFADASLGSVAILGEAKERKNQVWKMLTGIRGCIGAPEPPHHPAADHKKCQGTLAFAPRLFLAVAGGMRSVFPVRFDGEWFQLDEEEGDIELLRHPQSTP